MATASREEGIPVIEGLFTWPSADPRLIGTRCLSCNSYFFPRKQSCGNPKCKEKKIEDTLLSTEGKLWTYTVMRYPPVPPFRSDREPPYPVGVVELPEGIRVLGLLTGCEPEELEAGMDMKMVIDALYRDEDGQPVLTWKFKPVRKQDRARTSERAN